MENYSNRACHLRSHAIADPIVRGFVERWIENTRHNPCRNVCDIILKASSIREAGLISRQQPEPVYSGGTRWRNAVFSLSRSATGPGGVPEAAMGGA